MTNAQAVIYGMMMGMALGCEIAPRSIFHRKNYFYPDLRQGLPDLPVRHPAVPRRASGRRAHPPHPPRGGRGQARARRGSPGASTARDAAIVDYNRGGTPLAEIVTEPDIHSAEQARDWLQLLRETLRQLGVSDVNMEEGSLRCDANVSIRPVGSTELGTKTELKNMNSFRFVMQGINAEIARQTALVRGGRARSSRRRCTSTRCPGASARCAPRRRRTTTATSRSPTSSRSCPRRRCSRPPARAIPELPAERAGPLRAELGLPEDTAHLFAFEPEWGDYFERASAGAEPKAAGQLGDRAALARTGRAVAPGALAKLVGLVGAQDRHGRRRPHGLDKMVATGGDPAAIVEREGLAAMEDSGELEAIVAKVIAENPDVVERIKGGNAKAMGALVGPIMRETKGRADGGEVNRLLKSALGLVNDARRAARRAVTLASSAQLPVEPALQLHSASPRRRQAWVTRSRGPGRGAYGSDRSRGKPSGSAVSGVKDGPRAARSPARTAECGSRRTITPCCASAPDGSGGAFKFAPPNGQLGASRCGSPGSPTARWSSRGRCKPFERVRPDGTA